MGKTLRWDFIRSALAVRREWRDLERAGYSRSEPCWEIVRGIKYDYEIVDVKISVDKKHVWVKTAPGKGGGE